MNQSLSKFSNLFLVLVSMLLIFNLNSHAQCEGGKEDHGHGTWYVNLEDMNHNLYTGVVRCSFQRDDIVGGKYGALDKGMLQEDENAKYCGMCVEATGPEGSTIIQIVDECPDCWDRSASGQALTGTNTKFGDIDLSPAAFAAIVGHQDIGIGDFDWKEVSCPWKDGIKIIVEGSSRWYAKVIISNHVNRIAKVEISQAGKFVEMSRGEDNGFIKGLINDKFKDFRITDAYGNVITIEGVEFPETDGSFDFKSDKNFPSCDDSGGTDSGGTDSGGTDSGGTDSGGTDSGGTDSGGTGPGGTDSGETTSGSCSYPNFSQGMSLLVGDKVFHNGKVFEVKVATWASQGGAYEPGLGWAQDLAWTDTGETCDDGVTDDRETDDGATDDGTKAAGSCSYPNFSQGMSLSVGDKVFHNGKVFEVKVALWASEGGAYEPGVGWAQESAWNDTGEICDGSGTDDSSAGSTGDSTDGIAGGSNGGNTGGSNGGSTGDSTDGSAGGSNDGSTGDSIDGSAGGSNGGSTGDSTDGSAGGSNGGNTGGSNGGSTEDSTDGSAGGSNGGNTGDLPGIYIPEENNGVDEETNSIYEKNSIDYITAYPNPTGERITFDGLEDVNLIEILNVNGQIVAKLNLTESKERVGLDVSKFAPGIYVAKMSGDFRIGSVTFVKK